MLRRQIGSDSDLRLASWHPECHNFIFGPLSAERTSAKHVEGGLFFTGTFHTYCCHTTTLVLIVTREKEGGRIDKDERIYVRRKRGGRP